MAKKSTGKKLTPDEIMRLFRNVNNDDVGPQIEALRAAPRHREALVPQLIAAVNDVADRPQYYLRHKENWLPIFAVYLLAQFRETGAEEAFIRFFSLDCLILRNLVGDMIGEHCTAILASVCAPEPLLRLAKDEKVYCAVRQDAIDALAVQCVWGERSREAVIADLRDIHSSLRKPGDDFVWAAWVNLVAIFNATELLPEARQAYAEKLTFPGFIQPEEIDPSLPRSKHARTPKQLAKELREISAPINAVKNCIKCYTTSVEADEEDTEEDDDSDTPAAWTPPVMPDRSRFSGDFGRN